MKKLVAILILISHLNFSMFIPQVDEIDPVDANGCKYNDVNSLYEFIDEIVTGHTAAAPRDEDDDTGRFYHVVKIDNYCFTPCIMSLKRPELAGNRKTSFPKYKAVRLPSVFFDVSCPPPEV